MTTGNKIFIPWRKQSDLWWNDVCAKLIDHFGTPGGKYTASPDEDWMVINFLDNNDYLMCKMLLSEHIVERNTWTLTVGEDGTIVLNDEILKKTGWKEGDIIEWIDLKNGSWQLKKKNL
jgi:hypothetical protein